jgi:hypothetical protein
MLECLFARKSIGWLQSSRRWAVNDASSAAFEQLKKGCARNKMSDVDKDAGDRAKEKAYFVGADTHWIFFETIDEDLHAYSRYLEFHDKNFSAFSINLVRLYLSICSEVDVVAKMICEREKKPPTKKSSGIQHYREVITNRYPVFARFWVRIRPMQLSIQPWGEWWTTKDLHPPWWSDYNAVKHERNTSFSRANLENVLYSAAGLRIMLIYWYSPQIQKGRLNPRFRIFDTPSRMDRVIVTGAFLTQNPPAELLET